VRPPQQCFGRHTWNQATYYRRWGTMSSAHKDFTLRIRVTGSNDAHIGLSQKDMGGGKWVHRGRNEGDRPMFEIVLGGWGNHKSCLRRWPQDGLCNGNSGHHGYYWRFMVGSWWRWWYSTHAHIRRLGPHMQVWGGKYPQVMTWHEAFWKPGDWSQGRRRGHWGWWWHHDWRTRWYDHQGRGIRRDNPRYLYVMTGWGNRHSYWHVCLPSSGGPQYLGCWTDNGHRDFRWGPKHYRFVPTTCQSRCWGYHYFALQYDGWCCCDNRFGTKGPQRGKGECNKGGYGQGGPWRNAVYRTRRV